MRTKTCPDCDGAGVHVFGVTVYEPGCGYSHDSTDERPCPECRGTGRVWVGPGVSVPCIPDDDIVF